MVFWPKIKGVTALRFCLLERSKYLNGFLFCKFLTIPSISPTQPERQQFLHVPSEHHNAILWKIPENNQNKISLWKALWQWQFDKNRIELRMVLERFIAGKNRFRIVWQEFSFALLDWWFLNEAIFACTDWIAVKRRVRQRKVRKSGFPLAILYYIVYTCRTCRRYSKVLVF